MRGYFAPQHWYVCTLRLLAHERLFLKNAAQVKFHTGTSETGATLYLMEGDQLRAGETCIAQVRLDEPLVAGPGDRFIVRSLSPVLTVGGGTIIEALTGKLKRTRPGVLEDLEERAEAVGDDERFVTYCAKSVAEYAASAQELSLRAKVPAKRTQEILDELVEEGRRVSRPAKALHARGDGARARPAGARRPQGVPRKLAAEPRPDARAIAGADGPAEARPRRRGRAPQGRRRRHRARRAPGVGEPQGSVLRRGSRAPGPCRVALPGERPQPPSPDEAAAQTGMPASEVRRLVRLLAEQGRLVEVAEEMLFHRDAVEQARERLVAHLQKEGKFESVKFKYMLDTTRKYALPLLDYFDRIGLTLRVHNTRYLKTQKEPKAGR